MASRWFPSIVPEAQGAQANATYFVAAGLIRWDSIDDDPPDPLSAPGPLTHCNLDWINRYVATYFTNFNGQFAIQTQGLFDIVHLSEAKRRLGNDSGILFCAEAISPNPNAQTFFRVSADVRCLIKE
jgi:hypothetical protein